ncbi:MAG TPA: oligopeptide transporter, OPT family [Gammaproteobacteria bacterium]|nr:oligopeptide transporter, OPT family [Gammaproteobacteria bacterium]
MPPNSATPSVTPFIPASQSLPEITFKAVILSIILAGVLGASNAYLALKVGTTISASIPAAVISMAILRLFKNYNLLENNIVQTAASAGEGIAAAVAFVLPGLLIIGHWKHFDYWTTVFLIAIGGILGVLISIPLRRVMLNYPTLTFPEGTAVGRVLQATATGQSQIKKLLMGGLVGGLISLCQTGFQICSDNLQFWFLGSRSLVYGTGFGFSPAIIAAGFIIGTQTAITLLVGVIIGWVVGIPFLGHVYGLPTGDTTPYDMAMDLWSHHLRFVGVGTMLIGGLWTLITLLKPIINGLIVPLRALKQEKKSGQKLTILRTDRDISIRYLVWGSLILAILAFFMILHTLQASGIAMGTGHTGYSIGLIGAVYIVVGGFLVASICAYMGGLVGMTNNPLSGLMLISVLLISVILVPVFKFGLHITPSMTTEAVAIVLLITTVVAIVGAISGENLQDLKAGQMVGATPWKQQVMLLVGVVVSAFLISPVMELLFKAYGMGGVFPHPGMDPSQMLGAPQASLIAAVAKGAFGGSLPWFDISMGLGVGLVTIIIDEWLKTKGQRLPALAMGLAIYLPPEVMTPIIIGGLVTWLVKSRLRKQNGGAAHHAPSMEAANLLACGLVAGAALMGVILAIPFVIAGSSNAIKLVSDNFKPIADALGVISLLGVCVWLYVTGTAKASAEKMP